jgi:tetratricopeptide (TPR) repeat protein
MNTFYYIVPPILFIAATTYLIVFVLKKATGAGVNLSLTQDRGQIEPQKKEKKFWKSISQFLLKLLEKIVQRFKLYSLKFHNRCQNWFQSIKEKREKHELEKKSVAPVVPEKRETKIFTGNNDKKRPELNERVLRRLEEIKIEPMIKKEVVMPEMRSAARDRLEEALIERIATNPSDIEAYERLGDYYLEQGGYKEALECFKYVLKLSPAHHKAKLRVKRLERMLGK